MERLKRKIDKYLIEWKNNEDRLPLIIKGARQIGKTNAIRNFGINNYKTFIEINFAFMPQFKTIFENGFEVSHFVKNKNFSGILKMQQQILLDYEEDIAKYAGGLDKTKILNCYKKVPVFLGNENKKFQISKIANGARSRDYVGVIEWLANAGIVNICYLMQVPSLPFKRKF